MDAILAPLSSKCKPRSTEMKTSYTSLGKIIKRVCRPLFRYLLAASVSLSMASPALTAKHNTRTPNIIYILADDAGYGDFGIYGQKEIKTPHIDKMGKEGITFTQHYAGSTVCAPSRCSLLTGRHTGHCYIRGNAEIIPEGQMALAEGIPTIGNILKEAGMTTGIIGKWGLGGPGSVAEPSQRGFDHWFGYLCQRQAHSYYPTHLWRNGEKVELDKKTYTHDLFTEEALNFIKTNQHKPFFLYLPYTIPHAALQVPDVGEYIDKDWEENKKRYAAMITRMDRDVGRILALLKELNIDQKTLTVFSSDNGPHAEGGADPGYFNSSGPFRGKKRDLYEGGIRVPMIARWPGMIQPGSQSDHVSAFWDIMPTFAELAGGAIPADIDGISFVPTLTGNSQKQKTHDYLYWEFHELGGAQAVRTGDWKGIRKNVRLEPGSAIELYNLTTDIGETVDLADKHPKVVATINRIMQDARTVSPEFPLLGKMNYRFSIYNAWLFAGVFLVVSILLFVLARRKNRQEVMDAFFSADPMEKALYLCSFLITLTLCGFSLYLPLWGGTSWFTYGMIASLVGLAGYVVSQIHFYFRKPGHLMIGGLYRFSRNPKEVFGLIFWAGVGVATVSRMLFWLLILMLLVRYLVIRYEERQCLKRYGETYKQYMERTPQYLLFF